MLSFLEYYIRLRVEVLLGLRTTARPLGLSYRWRCWTYAQHLKRLRERAWLDEAVAEVKLSVGRRVEVAAQGRAYP